MTNYIRTEEGHIYEYVEQRIYPNQYAKFGLYRHNLNSEYEQIIAQSENLAELCDGFYIDDGTHNFLQEFIYEKWQYDGFTNALKEYNNLGKDYTGYGFIKTNKGLIYVVKMDTGELVLI